MILLALNDDIEFPRGERVGDVVHRLQQKLQPLGMDIKVVTDEYTGTQYYAMVNDQRELICKGFETSIGKPAGRWRGGDCNWLCPK
jgi:hypothetical protein